jgi:hypothetical protein
MPAEKNKISASLFVSKVVVGEGLSGLTLLMEANAPSRGLEKSCGRGIIVGDFV